MFYAMQDCGFKLLGIYRVSRKPLQVEEINRSHTTISYRLRGSSCFTHQQGRWEAGSESVCYIPGGCGYCRSADAPEELIILRLQGLGSIEPDIQVIPHAGELEPLFSTALQVWEEGGDCAYNRCMALLYRIFALLQEKAADQRQIPEVIAPGVALLQKNFRNPALTVAQLADTCFVSQVYFRRVYHSYAGEAPLQTILRLRYRYACSLLRSGYYSPRQVAELSGFSDVKYFRTTFRKRYGVTPTEYSKTRQS